MNDQQQPIIISVDGLIGAGKTALCELLGAKLAEAISEIAVASHDEYSSKLIEHAKTGDVTVEVIFEPVEIWKSSGALARFYADVKNRAYEFQSFVYTTRVEAVRDAVEKYRLAHDGKDADIYILERSVFSDEYLFVEMLYRDNILDDTQMIMYRKWCRMWDLLMPWFPSGFVYLSPSLEETMRRISARNRSGETVSLDYQSALLDRHEEVFGGETVHIAHRIGERLAYPVQHIRTDEDFRLENGGHKKIVSTIAQFAVTLATTKK